mmetsp:Transcript_2990/g.6211  ORF Transcript_2990/g.6211 Transcript_2990/m.6211 type:complete len:98 (-) Transcript_2990:2268-2561(-)
MSKKEGKSGADFSNRTIPSQLLEAEFSGESYFRTAPGSVVAVDPSDRRRCTQPPSLPRLCKPVVCQPLVTRYLTPSNSPENPAPPHPAAVLAVAAFP